MANAGPGTAGSDFFIMTPDIPAFDAKAGDIGFAAFGRVWKAGGRSVHPRLADRPTKGEG